MQIEKNLIKKRPAASMLLLAVLFSTLSAGEAQAQAKPTTAQPAPAKPSVTGPTGVVTSCPLLSSPFSSPAAKAQMQQVMDKENMAFDLVKTGDAFAQRGDWQNAQSQYQQALGLSPDEGLGHQLALYGLIAYCRATGDTAKGLDYSRQAIYHHGSAAEGFFENNTEKLMQFALLLNKTGQSAKAITVYNQAAYALDYQDSQDNGGKPNLKVLLPKVTVAPTLSSQVQHTPEHLQALIDAAIAHEEMGFGSNKEAITHMKEAVKLYPDSAAVQYYLGEALSRSYYVFLDSSAKDKAAMWAAYQEDKKATGAAYKKAAELGDDATVAAAKEQLAAPR